MCKVSAAEVTERENSSVVVFFFRSWAVDCCQKLLNYQTNKTGEAARFPWSSAHCKSSFMLQHAGSVNVEAGVVAGQWKAPLVLCLHHCPLVNDRAVGSWSFVYAVIKHSKPPGWQQAHSLAPGHSVENKTHLTLCFSNTTGSIKYQSCSLLWECHRLDRTKFWWMSVGRARLHMWHLLTEQNGSVM